MEAVGIPGMDLQAANTPDISLGPMGLILKVHEIHQSKMKIWEEFSSQQGNQKNSSLSVSERCVCVFASEIKQWAKTRLFLVYLNIEFRLIYHHISKSGEFSVVLSLFKLCAVWLSCLTVRIFSVRRTFIVPRGLFLMTAVISMRVTRTWVSNISRGQSYNCCNAHISWTFC